MATWQFPIYPADLVEQDPTQRDQFNNDEVGLAGALVREVIQNSSDAPDNTGPVKVRFALRELSGDDTEKLREMFTSLIPHLQASDLPREALTDGSATLLVIEDFNTHGLTGAVDELDEGNFRNFWRRHGKSGKGGKSGGRWGLGKLVYSSASRLNCFFGLTIRENDKGPLLMGQAVLATHMFEGKRRPAHGFWFKDKSDYDLQLPLDDPGHIADFCQLAGFARTIETGLSIAVPFPNSGITEKALIQGVVENYYFPILAGRLVVEVGDTLIDKDTFLHIAETASLPVPFAFVSSISQRLDATPDAESRLPVTTEGVTEAHFPNQLKALREKLANGELVHMRLPVEVTPATGKDAGVKQITKFDVFLQNPDTPGDNYSLFVRGALTVPGERRYFHGVAAYGAMVATDVPLASLLGDAENPAHTNWSRSAEKLLKRWKSGASAVSAVRHTPLKLQRILGEQVEQKVPDALVDFFSLIDETAEPKAKRKKKSTGKPPKIEPRQKSIIVQGRKGGFSVVGGPGTLKWAYPCQLRIRCSYDIIGADPFKRWSSLDFALESGDFSMSSNDADITLCKGNIIRLNLKSPAFILEAEGFDLNRDILVEARTV